MICRACDGAGSNVFFSRGKKKWWPCVPCGGGGALTVLGPKTIRMPTYGHKSGKKAEQGRALFKKLMEENDAH